MVGICLVSGHRGDCIASDRLKFDLVRGSTGTPQDKKQIETVALIENAALPPESLQQRGHPQRI